MTVKAFVGQTGAEMALFATFAAVYALPIWLSLPKDSALDDRALSALASPAVVRGLALDLATHLGLLALCYAGLMRLARQLARAAPISRPVAALVVLTAGWVWLVSGNAWMFVKSNYSLPFAAIANPMSWALSSVVLIALLALVLWRHGVPRLRAAGWLGAVALGIPVLWIAIGGSGRDAQAAGPASPRNVIIVGIDSLSSPLMAREQAQLPHLTQLLSQSTRYNRAYTPLGRTYPAWVTILSGKAPATHGALFNLRGVEQADRQDLLSRSLQVQGYHTVYAIDERRFNNIDESFGFDRVVGPQPGALDFVLQEFNDTPLTNLLLQTRVADLLLPYSRLNVASVANYDARGFVDEIGRASAGQQPLFLAVHFLSAHYPFATRHATLRHPDDNAIRAHHVEALTAVDTQIGWLMNQLSTQGQLEDSLVVVLSDHGEALGDNEPFRRGDGALVASSNYGHGSNLLSDDQNHIVLATIRYRHGQPVPATAPADEQVSLLDVRPAIEGFVRSGSVELEASSTCIPVQTELRLASAKDYRHLDTREVAAEGAGFYEVDDRGRLRLREKYLAALLAVEDVGLRCADRLTVFTPSDGRYRSYRLAPGNPPQEIEPLAADVTQINTYRRALQEQGELAGSGDHRKAAG